MDGNGFIAGVQSGVPLDRAYDDKWYDFSTVKYYQRGDFFGTDQYFVTVYFVDPAIICNGGRTQEEFEVEGTGNSFSIQVGPTPDVLEEIPLEQSGFDGQVRVTWFLWAIRSRSLFP